MEKKPIPFTQYKAPWGHAVETSIDRSSPIAEKALAIIERGYRFECEVLPSREISLTITNDDGDQAIEIIENGPEVPLAVDRLVENFAQRIFGPTAQGI